LNPKLTVNAGLRWEPFFPLVNRDSSILHFDMDLVRQGVKTRQFPNAPAGLLFPGDPGFPGKSGMYDQWLNFSPRLGFAWDVHGDGRMSVRASGGTFYDYPTMVYQVGLASTQPAGGRLIVNDVRLDDPWANYPGGDPFPMSYGRYVDHGVIFQPFMIATAMDYESPNMQVAQWNLSVQRQVGTDWLVSTTYLGTHTIHLWGTQPINPSVYIPGGPCTLRDGKTYNPCSTTANANQRRRLMLDPAVPLATAQGYGLVNKIDTGGTANYNGMVVSVQRRATGGVTLNTNYTWSHCISDWWSPSANSSSGKTAWTNPDNRRFERGNCNQGASDRRHIFNLSAVVETPQFANRSLRIFASGWRLSPIFKLLSGDYMQVTTSTDVALNDVENQRVNLVMLNPYGDKTAANYLNPAAFARPATGTLGNLGRASIRGPGRRQFDLALSRTFQFHETQRFEFRAEAFNVTNSFYMNNPTTNLNSNTFGQVTSAGDPRIMQFALKYFF
jgi:hypothetical protein